jgi:hypothetical protein
MFTILRHGKKYAAASALIFTSNYQAAQKNTHSAIHIQQDEHCKSITQRYKNINREEQLIVNQTFWFCHLDRKKFSNFYDLKIAIMQEFGFLEDKVNNLIETFKNIGINIQHITLEVQTLTIVNLSIEQREKLWEALNQSPEATPLMLLQGLEEYPQLIISAPISFTYKPLKMITI